PAPERPVPPEHLAGRRAGAAEIVVRRLDLGRERAGMEAPSCRQHREAADAAHAEAVEVGLAIAVEGCAGAAAGVEQDLESLKEASRVGGGPCLERRLRVRRER